MSFTIETEQRYNSHILRDIFQKNGYPENFIDICFKLFLNLIHILKNMLPTVEKKPLRLALPAYSPS